MLSAHEIHTCSAKRIILRKRFVSPTRKKYFCIEKFIVPRPWGKRPTAMRRASHSRGESFPWLWDDVSFGIKNKSINLQKKNMAVRFEFYETPAPNDKRGDKKYHARVVSYNTAETEEIIHDIHSTCTLTPGDIKACITELSRVLVDRLRGGERVHLEGLGYFQVTLQCDSSDTNPKTRADHVKYKTIKFQPDKKLNADMQTLKVERSDMRKHSSSTANEVVDARLEEYFTTNTIITRRKLETLCELTRTTAGRHINRLIAENKIKNMSPL